MLVKHWISGFIDRHRARFDPHDWPADGSDEWREYLTGWVTAFATAQVSETEADSASIALVETPPNFRREHLPAVMKAVRERRPEAVAPASTREAASDASKSCPHCSGSGITQVTGTFERSGELVERTVAAHCACPHGRWIRNRIAQQEEHLLKRIPDLAEVFAGRSAWRYDDPSAEPDLAPAIRMIDDYRKRLTSGIGAMPGLAPVPVPVPSQQPETQTTAF